MWVVVRGQKAGRSGWLLRLLFQVVVDQRLAVGGLLEL